MNNNKAPVTQNNMADHCGIRGRIISAGLPISMCPAMTSLGLTRYLEMFLELPVIDETEIAGRFDIDLQWKENAGRYRDHTALKQVLLDQLGLELVADRWPAEMLVREKVAKK